MKEILLVFAINGGLTDISDKIFTSVDECKQFVNTLANMEVFNKANEFKFIASDGALFEGECVDMREWFLKKGKLEI